MSSWCFSISDKYVNDDDNGRTSENANNRDRRGRKSRPTKLSHSTSGSTITEGPRPVPRNADISHDTPPSSVSYLPENVAQKLRGAKLLENEDLLKSAQDSIQPMPTQGLATTRRQGLPRDNIPVPVPRGILKQEQNETHRSCRRNTHPGEIRSGSPSPPSIRRHHQSPDNRARAGSSKPRMTRDSSPRRPHQNRRSASSPRSTTRRLYSPPPPLKTPLWKTFLPVVLMAIVKLLEPDGGWNQYNAENKSRKNDGARGAKRRNCSDRREASPYPYHRHHWSSPRPERKRGHGRQREYGSSNDYSTETDGTKVPVMSGARGGKFQERPERREKKNTV